MHKASAAEERRAGFIARSLCGSRPRDISCGLFEALTLGRLRSRVPKCSPSFHYGGTGGSAQQFFSRRVCPSLTLPRQRRRAAKQTGCSPAAAAVRTPAQGVIRTTTSLGQPINDRAHPERRQRLQGLHLRPRLARIRAAAWASPRRSPRSRPPRPRRRRHETWAVRS